ncbi:MAG: TIGR03067 domain-containing protein [Planctomycetes bacterium]|nr:TIGR03067 domain-containing protein [Planctomycetota bacterium]
MTRCAVALAFLAVAAAGLARADEKAALKELEGTYKLMSAEQDGKFAEKDTIATVTVTIKGDEFVLSAAPDDKKLSKIKVTPDTKLANIDFSPQDGLEKGKTFPGIYKLEKGELTIAFSEKGDRPKEFKSDNGVMILKLKKAEK